MKFIAYRQIEGSWVDRFSGETKHGCVGLMPALPARTIEAKTEAEAMALARTARTPSPILQRIG